MSSAVDYVQLTHAASEIDGTIDEVYAARGSYGNLSLKIASKQDALTTAQLAAANSGITVEKLTADEAALVELVDSGAKNYAKESETIETTSTWLGQIPVSPLQGECVFSAATTWESGLCDLYGYEQGGTRTHLGTVTVSNYKIIKKYTTDKDFIYVQIYYNNATAKKLTNVMICTAQDWAISQKFVPYRPSWQEMYDMIITLQNGTRSAPALAMSAEPEVEPETGEEEMR